MSETVLRRMAYASFALIYFVCTLVIARWTIDFVTWSSLDSGWAQAIGTIAAIIGTWATTRRQILHAERLRELDKLEAAVGTAQIALDLAGDTHRCLGNIYSKFVNQLKCGTHAQIGTERLQDLQESLRDLAHKHINPAIAAEILILKREVAYTLTALTQHNRREKVSMERVEKAMSRLVAIFETRQRLCTVLRLAKSAIGNDTPVVEQSVTSPDD